MKMRRIIAGAPGEKVQIGLVLPVGGDIVDGVRNRLFNDFCHEKEIAAIFIAANPFSGMFRKDLFTCRC